MTTQQMKDLIVKCFENALIDTQPNEAADPEKESEIIEMYNCIVQNNDDFLKGMDLYFVQKKY